MKLFIASFLLMLPFFTGAQKITILFDFNRYSLTSRSIASLDSLVKQPSFSAKKIQLSGHTDSIGSNEYNDELSQKRINAVHKFLLTHNVSENNIETEKAMGRRLPLNDNSAEEKRHANRRVDILLTEKTEAPPIAPAVISNTGSASPRSLQEQITDTTLKAGTNIILHNLNFIGGRHILLPQSQPVLEELLEGLKINPTIEIEIQGHICCAPGKEDGLDIDTHTYDLSFTRAREIYIYLMRHGISPSRLSYKGFGHSMPLVYPEDTESKRITNRRVEIRIIHK